MSSGSKSFEAIIPSPNWPEKFTFSPGVRTGNLLFLSGTVATDDTGQIVGVGDIVAQTRQIFRKFKAILEHAGASMNDIVETTEYVTTFENYPATAEVRREFFGGPPWPTATGVMVKALYRPHALIEIKAVAVLS